MSSFRLLDLIKPFGSIIPEIESPYTLDFDEKIVFTFISAALYIFLQFPICGLPVADQLTRPDPFSWLRPVTGSEKGTLLEFGLLPVLTSGFIWQTVSGLKLISVNFNLKSDRQLFQTLQKVTSVVLSAVYGIALLASGYYEQVGDELSLAAKLTILFQIVGTTLVTTLVVELLDKGYGFSSGALTLITVSAAGNFAANVIGIQGVLTGRGGETVGAVINLVRSFGSKPFGEAIVSSFTRTNLANLTQFYVSLLTIAATLYFANFRVELSIKNTKVRSMSSVYPIKLLYCGALPILFTFTVLYNLNIFGYAIFKLFGQNDFVKLLASFDTDLASKSVLYSLNGGLLYFISPSTIATAPLLFRLVRPFTYAAFIVLSSTVFATVWAEISGSSAKDVAKSFKEQDIALLGHRDVAVARELNKVIPVAAATGGAILGSIVAAGEFLGGLGSGVAVAVSVVSGLTILESVMLEFQQGGGKSSSFAQVFNPNQ